MGKLEKTRSGWEYTSDMGITYLFGEVSTELNVVMDDFMDVNELFDGEVLVKNAFVTYVYGDLERDALEIQDYLDDVVDKYEQYERTVRFYTNQTDRDDSDVLYECYIGTEAENPLETTIITEKQLCKMAREIVANRKGR